MTDDPRALAAKVLAASRYAMPREEALAEIRARRTIRRDALPSADPAAAEPLSVPIIDDVEGFVRDWWAARTSPEAPPRRAKKAPLRLVKGTAPRDGDNSKGDR